jgi:hypothetical protein
MGKLHSRCIPVIPNNIRTSWDIEEDYYDGYDDDYYWENTWHDWSIGTGLVIDFKNNEIVAFETDSDTYYYDILIDSIYNLDDIMDDLAYGEEITFSEKALRYVSGIYPEFFI